MNSKKRLQWIIILIVTLLLLAGCGGQAPVQPKETATPVPPTATDINPPAAGDWIATTGFGKVVFTVDKSGKKITKVSYQLSNWTCGPTTQSGTIGVGPAEWPITGGKFLVTTSFDPDNKQTMKFGGTYDAGSQTFSGTWDGASYGTDCPGTWTASAPK